MELTQVLSDVLKEAFTAAGYDAAYAQVKVSDRPDLCEFQCNGAMAAAKAYHKAPFMIADDVLKHLPENDCIGRIEVVKPGFINIDSDPAYISRSLSSLYGSGETPIPQAAKPRRIVIDYGGPNVAKPLHVGHLRSAVIGESIKRISMNPTRAIIRKKLPSPSANWRRSIRRLRPDPRKTRPTRPAPWRPPTSCRWASAATARSGNVSWRSPSPI